LTEKFPEERWLPFIREALNRPLPGDVSHARLLPPGRSLVSPDKIPEDLKNSSVLILLFPENEEIFCCLLKRQSHLRYHAGQIGFPGGRMEKEDHSLRQTAIRESREEIGVQLSIENIIGSLSELYVSVSGFLISPFVAWISCRPHFKIDQQEVDKLLFLPVLSFLRNGKIIQAVVESQTGFLAVPAYELDGEFIWGATAMILAEFFDILEVHPEE
jgi:8-oxo-dGTP pyrophosphatase MutT (NUDIX family)